MKKDEEVQINTFEEVDTLQEAVLTLNPCDRCSDDLPYCYGTCPASKAYNLVVEFIENKIRIGHNNP